MNPRLTAEFWVSAYLTRLRLVDIPVFVARKGDKTAGSVLVKLNTLDGQAKAFQRQFNLISGELEWIVMAEGAEADVDASLYKQAGFDRDIWVLEVEDRDGRHLLDDPSLA
ncbi:MAG: DUF1491 family protein [Octadecabacter sp.]|nr:DUF1491 family protein [Octadecabacter sp.]